MCHSGKYATGTNDKAAADLSTLTSGWILGAKSAKWVRVYPGMKITLYREANYQGTCVVSYEACNEITYQNHYLPYCMDANPFRNTKYGYQPTYHVGSFLVGKC